MQTQVLFFWASGVLFPTLDTALAEALSSLGASEVDLTAMPGYPEMREMFMLGNMNEHEFSRAVMKFAGVEASPEQLRARFLDRLSLAPGVLEAIAIAKSGIDRWLVVDLPEAWWSRVSSAGEVYRHFSPEKSIYLGKTGLSRLIPDVFGYLPAHVQVPAENCLLVDAEIKRTVAAINHGLPAAVSVNAHRLKRELLLRGMGPQPHPVHQRRV